MICEHCGKEHDGTFGSGRFCSITCANTRTSIIKKLYTCVSCGKEFISTKNFRKGRLIKCNDCIQVRPHYKNDITSILDVSKRTITKILKRANKGCSICGWKESTCDIHHIIPRSKGGTDNINNLIIVCPNCHRVLHTTDKYNVEYLTKLSIDKTFTDWKEYYHIKN